MKNNVVSAVLAAAFLTFPFICGPVSAEDEAKHTSSLQKFVHGAPAAPTEAWLLGAGGRIYDNWWDALDRRKPRTPNPAYPKTSKRSGATTWRCVECHGWDYKGRDGLNGKDGALAERYTGAPGIQGAQKKSVADITKLLRDSSHGYTAEMISDDEARRVAEFVRNGQHDTDAFIDPATGKAKGDATRGAGFYQTLCAACHGFEGKALNWGTRKEPGFIGTEAQKLPWEVLHKARNGHPGAAMINLRALPMQDAVDVLTYAQTLPAK
ncbi:MAG: c-type cytochrome [Hyphomicrobiaceae bacterium]